MEIAPLLFDLGPSKPTTRQIADLRAFLREAGEWAIDRVTFVSPFDPRIKYNQYSALLATTAHQRHHLWLGERVAEALGLKAAS